MEVTPLQLPISLPRRRAKAVGIALAALLAALLLRRPLLQVLELLFGASALSFLALPLEKLYEKRLPRPAASLTSLLTLALFAVGLLWLLLPAMLREIMELGRTLPEKLAGLTQWLAGARAWLEGRLPGLRLPEIDLSALNGPLSVLAGGTVSFAANVAGTLGQVSMMVVLAYFLLKDRETVLLRLELLLPRRVRAMAVRMGNAACRELRLYLQGQLMIAGVVAALSFAALTVVGVRSAIVLGPLIGLLNMIPYFGPFIGGIPAVLIALADSWQRAALTLAALAVVQQLDGYLISPRVMGSVTGLTPAVVLVGIYAGARVGGVAGMLLAIPAMLVFRSLYRIFMQKYENI